MTPDTVARETVHATSVSIGGRAVLIEGPSGAGKSDLALRLIDRGAVLVSDDYTALERAGDALIARAPATIRGKIEVRGLGILPIEAIDGVPVSLSVRLGDGVERMPLEERDIGIAGVRLPQVRLDGLEASAPIKVELALKRVIG